MVNDNWTHILKDEEGERPCKFVSDNMIMIKGDKPGEAKLCRVYSDMRGGHPCNIKEI